MAETAGFEIQKCEARIENGQECVRVYFRYRSPKGKYSGTLGGWVDLIPEWYWVVRKFSILAKVSLDDENGGQQLNGTCEYSHDASGGVPLIKRRVWTATTTGDTGQTKYTVDFTKFVLGKLPNSDFEPSAFGVRTAIAVHGMSLLRRLMLMATVAIILGLAAVILFKKSRRMYADGSGVGPKG